MEAATHGADGGFGGFITYSETSAFTKRNRRAIAEWLTEDADGFGQTPSELIRSFRCLDNPSEEAIACALYGAPARDGIKDDVMLVENALAWYALEAVGCGIESEADNA